MGQATEGMSKPAVSLGGVQVSWLPSVTSGVSPEVALEESLPPLAALEVWGSLNLDCSGYEWTYSGIFPLPPDSVRPGGHAQTSWL